jgi:hypothetical protein
MILKESAHITNVQALFTKHCFFFMIESITIYNAIQAEARAAAPAPTTRLPPEETVPYQPQ